MKLSTTISIYFIKLLDGRNSFQQSLENRVMDLIQRYLLTDEVHLVLVDVEAEAAELAALQGLQNGGQVHQTAPGSIDQHGRLFHHADGLFIDQMVGGGEQRRVAMARALVNNPKILLADEPTGNLDNKNAWEIMNLLEEINSRGTTVVVVTHNLEIVRAMGKRVITIKKGVIASDLADGSALDDMGDSHAN